jgi:formate dehydrogenase maturation protein FdhE
MSKEISRVISRVKGIGPITAERFYKAGITTIEEIAQSKPEELAWIKGIGITSANKIIENAKEILRVEDGIQKVLNSIKENFTNTCPKCGSPLKEKLIILGTERRLRVYQCTVCKFYMPK